MDINSTIFLRALANVKFIEPYKLDTELGRGGMGIVFKAKNRKNGRVVALKILNIDGIVDNRSRVSIVREAGTATTLQHPNIVSVYEVAQWKGMIYIAMECLEGETLARLIRRRSALSLKTRLNIVAELCEALSFAHEKGIAHLDVKPSNIFIIRDGSVKLIDFGLSVLADFSFRKRGELAGTVPYMSPEQVQGAKIDEKSDIWAAGVTLFELLTGRLPFTGDTILDQILTAPVPHISQHLPLSSELNVLIRHAMHKVKEQRCASAKQLAMQLRNLMLSIEDPKGLWLPSDASQLADHMDETTVTRFGDTEQPRQLLPAVAEPRLSARQSQPEPRGLDLGFKHARSGKIEISTKGFNWIAFARRQLPGYWKTAIPTTWLVSVLSIIVLYLADKLANWILVVAALANILSYFALISLSKGILLLNRLIHYPQCWSCSRPMLRTSIWTNCPMTSIEQELCSSECVVALESGLWEEAAKIIVIYGPQTRLVLNGTWRNQLEFYECETCNRRAAMFTIADWDIDCTEWNEASWFIRPQFVYATADDEPVRSVALNTFARVMRLPNTALFILRETIERLYTDK